MRITVAEKYFPHCLALIGAAVFANSFFGVFVFDEYTSIDHNEAIRHLWPPKYLWEPPNDTRPIIGLSLAINYAMHGLHFWPYHLLNLIIHLTSALALYGIVRRTFLCEKLRGRFGAEAAPLAFLIALIWMIHPLQTASVTYVIQRCESMMGMFFLLTLYCVIRSADPNRPLTPEAQTGAPLGPLPEGEGNSNRRDRSTRVRWSLMAICFSTLGMGCKQVMVTAPVIVFLYDRAFLGGSIAEALRRRWGLYLGLLASCAVLITSAVHNPPGGPSAGFGLTCVTKFNYFLTQLQVIPHYLRLAFWPDHLYLDYSWPFVTSPLKVLPQIVFFNLIWLVFLIGVIKNTAWGFLGAWFFIILAPSSSIMPILDAVFEHRMYLSLAALAAGFVLFAEFAIRKIVWRMERRHLAGRTPALQRTQEIGVWVFSVVALALSIRTIARNDDYRLQSTVWGPVAERFKDSDRAANNLGNAFAIEKRHAEAITCFQSALRIKPDYTDAEYNLGVEYSALGKKEEALEHYARALKLNADYPQINCYMGDVLRDLQRDGEAIEHYQLELYRDPKCADAYYGRGAAYSALGEKQQALDDYARALEQNEKFPKAHYAMGEILLELKRVPEARAQYEAELKRDPKDADAKRRLDELGTAPTTTEAVSR
ncbi:MAG TPA: tetratricopeptide repeat protein [Planctomycetota bacterium]|nr:tetratricopeptide repeat protein [Planctomycetota bacterium]